MRCDQCNKFVAFEEQDPEAELEVSADEGDMTKATVTGPIRCVLACGECGQELKEANFEVDEEVDNLPDKCKGDGPHDWSIDFEVENEESGGYRYKKNMRGYTANFSLTCSRCNHKQTDLYVEDSIPASQWDELV